jgi:hypothetical protein
MFHVKQKAAGFSLQLIVLLLFLRNQNRLSTHVWLQRLRDRDFDSLPPIEFSENRLMSAFSLLIFVKFLVF